jgi:hypothetical protein
MESKLQDLYMLYVDELLKLNLGYPMNKLTIQQMINIIGDIVIIQINNNETDQ